MNKKAIYILHKRFPMWKKLSIEINSYCNRDCNFCPRYFDNSGVRKDKKGKKVVKKMPSDKVYDVINQASKLGFKGSVSFHRLSESLLDERYVKFVTYTKRKGIKVCQATNGDVLRSNKELCSKLDGLVDKFVIGLYDYKTFGEKLKEIIFWKTKFKKTKIRFSRPLEFPIIRQNSNIYNVKRKNTRMLNLPCFKTHKQLLIRYDGEVSLCCEDDNCYFDLGNVFDESLDKIWWSDKHISLVKELRKSNSRHNFELCSKCYTSKRDFNLNLIRKAKIVLWNVLLSLGLVKIENQKR